MKPITLSFFGSHVFAVSILDALIAAPNIEVAYIITQPDKPAGRKKELQSPPVKVFAQTYPHIPLFQPETLKNYTLPDTPIDLCVVAQYGNIIPERIITAPKHNTLNVHTSLLPQYRGASPIQSALIDGQTTTGTTIMCMDKGLDTGPTLAQKAITIDPDDTYITLSEKLATLSAELLITTIPEYVTGTILPQKQNDEKATHCKQIKKEEGQIDWRKTAQEIYNRYRGLYFWPGIWTTWNGKRLKLLSIEPATEQVATGTAKVIHDILYIGCASGSIRVHQLQLENKKAMDTTIFLKGNSTIHGAQLG